ncbi:ROK family protein [Galbitalea soli]|uniref:ROK family protein n=1 Tax=Galbitalea soli TaxID=1268042 RepID=UPI0018497CD5|nr:putative NBD/HSP70 family sugar kinase [Galbitalea soli]
MSGNLGSYDVWKPRPSESPVTPAEAAKTLGNSNDRVRVHNLSVVLRLVHRTGGVPRSSLTRQTGLNRSTVAALVGELVERQLVVEGEPDARNQVGRPSPMTLPGDRPVGIAVNPEIDAITVGVVGLGGRVLRRVRRATAVIPTAEQAAEITADIVAELRAELEPAHRVFGIGVAVPGLVRVADGLVRLAPHLGWENQPFAAMLARATGLPVRAANDANLGTLAESTFGAGRGVSDFIYLNGGASGIGGGILAGGELLFGADGYAGELGHTIVTRNGIRCHCGGAGCLETEVRREPLLELLGLDDADADELEAALLASDDRAVLAEVHRQLDHLGFALGNAINALNPRLIVLGGFLGSISAAEPDHLDRVVAAGPLSAARGQPSIVPTELGASLLMIGAAELALEAVLEDPTLG